MRRSANTSLILLCLIVGKAPFEHVNVEGYATGTVRGKAAEGPTIAQTQRIPECLFVEIESKVCHWDGREP